MLGVSRLLAGSVTEADALRYKRQSGALPPHLLHYSEDKKPVVVWFGMTCHQEIDVYGRGIKVLSSVPCRPCWQSSCSLETKCYRELPWTMMAGAIAEMAETIQRDGSWKGERLLGTFPPKDRIQPPLGISPGPIL